MHNISNTTDAVVFNNQMVKVDALFIYIIFTLATLIQLLLYKKLDSNLRKICLRDNARCMDVLDSSIASDSENGMYILL